MFRTLMTSSSVSTELFPSFFRHSSIDNTIYLIRTNVCTVWHSAQVILVTMQLLFIYKNEVILLFMQSPLLSKFLTHLLNN